MVKGRFSTGKKVLAVICCIVILAAAVLLAAGYADEAGKREHYIQLHLQKAAGRIAGQVSGDGLLSLGPGDEETPAYHTFATALYEARKNDTYLSAAYLMRIDNGTIRYVVVDAYLTHGNDGTVPRIGDLVTEDRSVILNASVHGPFYSPKVYTSRWGSFLSGYAPVKDSSGTVVAVLGVDEPADTIFQYEYSQLLHLVEVS